MAKRNVTAIRAAKRFDEFLQRAAAKRIENKIDKRMKYDSELTDMMLNCPSFVHVAKELTTLPRREDIK